MYVLTIRTDKPDAEIALFDDLKQLTHLQWEAHRQLAESLHSRIAALLDDQHIGLSQIEGIVIYQGPGSFTGLRIGVSVANALADGLNVPIVGQVGDWWTSDGIKRLIAGENDSIVIPEYGALPHITAQKK